MKFFIAVVLASLIAASSPAQNTGGGGTVYLRQLERGTAGYVITGQGAGGAPIYTALAGAGLGDFSGPASSTANAIVRFSGVGGKTGKNSGVTIADTTDLMIAPLLQVGTTTATATGNVKIVLGEGAGIGARYYFNIAASNSATTGWQTATYGSGKLSGFSPATNGIGLYTNSSSNADIGTYSLASGSIIFGAISSDPFTNTTTTTTELARIKGTSGNLLIGGTTDIGGTGGLKVFGTTAATSTTTGSLQNSGGFGNAGPAYIGGNTFLLGNLTVTGVTTIATSTPVNAVATGNPGYVVWDANFIYICVAANTWKRVAIATW